jgi:NAD+ diphosphatase
MLGHQATWPERRFSAFAGFVEPGESFESAVLREVAEEAGIQVGELRYLGSQPWPFPASVMVAYEVIADNPEDARADGLEITELKWWTRAQLKSESDSGELILPPKISVARAMIDRWFSEKSDESLGGKDQWRN